MSNEKDSWPTIYAKLTDRGICTCGPHKPLDGPFAFLSRLDIYCPIHGLREHQRPVQFMIGNFTITML